MGIMRVVGEGEYLRWKFSRQFGVVRPARVRVIELCRLQSLFEVQYPRVDALVGKPRASIVTLGMQHDDHAPLDEAAVGCVFDPESLEPLDDDVRHRCIGGLAVLQPSQSDLL